MCHQPVEGGVAAERGKADPRPGLLVAQSEWGSSMQVLKGPHGGRIALAALWKTGALRPCDRCPDHRPGRWGIQRARAAGAVLARRPRFSPCFHRPVSVVYRGVSVGLRGGARWEGPSAFFGPVLEALCAFVRESTIGKPVPKDKPTSDVQAALTVIGRRIKGPGAVYLTNVSIPGANLESHADPRGANLSGSDLNGANLGNAGTCQ
jgi:hypothetical protein